MGLYVTIIYSDQNRADTYSTNKEETIYYTHMKGAKNILHMYTKRCCDDDCLPDKWLQMGTITVPKISDYFYYRVKKIGIAINVII